MKFEAKPIPERINTSREHPLKEFFLLASGLILVVVLVTGTLFVSADYLIGYIPVAQENEWFSKTPSIGETQTSTGSDSSSKLQAEQYLQHLVETLASPEYPEFRFTVHMFPERSPNAFVLPGGHIFVTSGLLEFVESENGLAMVLAHEMAHQYHRHPLRSLGRGVVISLALLVISGSEGGEMAQGLIGNTATLTHLGFNRDQEREADALGVSLLMDRYGHAGGSTEFFDIVSKLSSIDTELPGFLSTHPGVAERIDMLRGHVNRSNGPTTSLDDVIGRYLESLSD